MRVASLDLNGFLKKRLTGNLAPAQGIIGEAFCASLLWLTFQRFKTSTWQPLRFISFPCWILSSL